MTADPSARTVDATARLRGWVERESRVALATQPLRHALNQREHYTDLRGINHPLSDMTAAEASLVLALLERHAPTLHRGELAEHLLRLDNNSREPGRLSRHTARWPPLRPRTGFARRRFTARSLSAPASDSEREGEDLHE